MLRHVLLAIDQRLGLANGIFQLQLDEIDRLQDENFRSEAADLIQKRAKEARLFKRVKHLPAQLSVDDLETISLLGGSAKVASDPMKLMGTLVAGEAPVEGTAFIINGDEGFVNPEDIQALPADAIILTRLVHPQWLPWLVQARGVVCEVGGWLSHTAILAREYNLPMVVGVRGLDQIRQGDRLRLHQDGRVEKCLEAAVAAE